MGSAIVNVPELPAREMKRAGLDTVLSNKYRAHTEGREEDKAGDEYGRAVAARPERRMQA